MLLSVRDCYLDSVTESELPVNLPIATKLTTSVDQVPSSNMNEESWEISRVAPSI